MKKPKNDPKVRSIALNPNPKGEYKRVGGSMADDWNLRLLNSVNRALPIKYSDLEASDKDITAVCQAMVDMAPADPIEGILIAQLMAASDASLAMYQNAWAQPPEFFEARTKYLQLADKAARTVALLTERLDHHRGRGQQQITVKHVTTNNVTADQAIIAESVSSGSRAVSPALLAANSETPMPISDEARLLDPVGRGKKTK
jgi:hypothetical protein